MYVIVTKENESVIYNGKIYGHGQSFEVADIIGNSLVERGLCRIEGGASEDVAEMQTGTLDEAQLNDMSYADLRRLAAQMGLDASGKKDELIARISAVEVEVEPDGLSEAEADDFVEEEDIPGELPNTSMPD